MLVCVAVSASLLLKRHRTSEHFCLGIAFVLLAISNGAMVCYSMGHWTPSPVLDLISISSTLLSSAVYYIYVMSVTNPNGVQSKHFLIFVPTAVLVVANIIADCLLGIDDTRRILYDMMSGNIYRESMTGLETIKVVVDSNIFRATNFAQTVAVVVYGRFQVKAYLKSLGQYYSNKGGAFKDSEWKVVYYTELMIASMLLMCVVPYNVMRQFPVAMVLMSLMFSFSLAMLGISGHVVKGNAREFKKIMDSVEEIKAEVEEEGIPTKKYIEKVKVGLEKFIEEKGYLDPNVTAEDLAQRISTNRYYLSETLRTVYKESFSSFVNKRRIEYAKELISTSSLEDKVLKSIAIDAGYNNFVNFYRNFVKYTGKNPTDWKKEQVLSGKLTKEIATNS